MGRLLQAAFLGAALLALPGMVRAQSASVSMSADRTEVRVGDTFQVQIRAEVTGATMDDQSLPSFDAFQVLGRREVHPMQFRFGFGNRQQIIQSTTVWSFTLRAVSEGTFQIEPARVTVGGRSHESNSLRIVVGAGSGATPTPVPGTEPAPPGNVSSADVDPTAFLRTVVDKERVYEGEQITVTVYLYSRGGLRSSPTVHEEPVTDGFWVHDLLAPNRTLDPHRQVVAGAPYNVYVLRRFAAFPLESGDLPVGGMELSLRHGSLFDLFNSQTQDVRRRGDPVKVHVRPLPAQGKPSGQVVVGTFGLEASVDRTQVATGDAVTLTATVRGTGNVRNARLELPRIPGLRVLQPQVRDEITTTSDLVGGTRTYEWLVVPEEPGTHRIPGLELHTFDPQTATYATVRSEPLTLLAAGNAVQAGEMLPEDRGADRAERGPDAHRFGPVRVRSELERRGGVVSTATWYAVALTVPPLAWLGLLIGGFLRKRIVARGHATASQRAVKRARRRLDSAQRHARGGEARAFYVEIFQVLKDVLEARLGEPVGGFTHDELRRHLVGRGMPEDLATRVVDELEGLEFARFSATGVERDEMESCLSRVQALLERLDRFAPAAEVDR